MIESAALVLAVIGLSGLLCQWFAWSIKLPAILFLLLAGIFLGPVIGWLNPDELLGDLFFPLVSLSVAIILFEGSLTLKFEQIRGLASVVRRLVSVGVLITWLIMSAACHFLLALSWPLSLLFGSLVVVTGPTVIVPMLRSVRPNARIANILRWEGIVIDPVGALLAVLVYESIVSFGQGGEISHTLLVFFKTLLVGGVLGCATGYLLGIILRRQWLPSYLHNLATITLVLLVFAGSNSLQHESGLLSVTLMGIWLANMKDVDVEEILSFKENLSTLLISGLFILLAARIDLDQIAALGWGAVILLACIQFVARPLAVAASTVGTDLSWSERFLIGWIGPRGIVAAAISALFALRLEAAGFEQASLLVALTFIIIIGTVVFQSATARPLARLLKVSEPSPRGFLLVGANPVARAVAKVLESRGFTALLTDSNWENIKTARMEGLNTFYGNPVSEYADSHLDLVGIGHLLGLSPQRELNALACMRYRLEFGENCLFSLPNANQGTTSEKRTIASKHKGHTLFDSELSFSKFASLLSQGAKTRVTTLTDTFSFSDLLAQQQGKLYPLFAIDGKDHIYVFCDDREVTPEAGWSVISLEHAPPVAETNSSSNAMLEDQK
ncbi:MAG: sodium:proton antiporter [Pseudomonadales bacterium]